jgi:hypothetical protein
MVSRHLDLRALLTLLRTVSLGRLAGALFAVWYLTPVDPASAVLAWAIAAPLELLGWYAALSAVARLHRALPSGLRTQAAWTAVACGAAWVVVLTPVQAWLYALTALCAVAFAVAGTLRRP